MRLGFITRTRRLLFSLVTGCALLQLQSCSPGVSDTILIGLETTSLTFAQVLISTLFEGLGNGGTGAGSLFGGLF